MIESPITGKQWVSVKVDGREIKLDPTNPRHRVVAQVADEKDIRENFPHLVGMIADKQWRISSV